MADPKSYRLEIFGPVWDFLWFIWEWYKLRQVREFLSPFGNQDEVRPNSCKRIKRNVWKLLQSHAGLSSSRSHVNTPLGCLPVVIALFSSSHASPVSLDYDLSWKNPLSSNYPRMNAIIRLQYAPRFQAFHLKTRIKLDCPLNSDGQNSPTTLGRGHLIFLTLHLSLSI